MWLFHYLQVKITGLGQVQSIKLVLITGPRENLPPPSRILHSAYSINALSMCYLRTVNCSNHIALVKDEWVWSICHMIVTG
jgi:hypothetical protein